jgi:hypothetical protein
VIISPLLLMFFFWWRMCLRSERPTHVPRTIHWCRRPTMGLTAVGVSSDTIVPSDASSAPTLWSASPVVPFSNGYQCSPQHRSNSPPTPSCPLVCPRPAVCCRRQCSTSLYRHIWTLKCNSPSSSDRKYSTEMHCAWCCKARKEIYLQQTSRTRRQ